jgi:hypothetical protein
MTSPTMLAGFLKWETGSGDVRLCDGGVLEFDGETYTSRHAVFGAISGFDPFMEGIGDESPAGTLTFSPAPDASPATINSPLLQGSRIRMWISEVDRDTGEIVGTPDLQLDNIVDVSKLRLGKNVFELAVDIVSRTERLFLVNEGNVLSGERHRQIYPGELGLNNAIGVPQVVAWGVVGAPRGTATYSGGGFGGSYGGVQARMIDGSVNV